MGGAPSNAIVVVQSSRPRATSTAHFVGSRGDGGLGEKITQGRGVCGGERHDGLPQAVEDRPVVPPACERCSFPVPCASFLGLYGRASRLHCRRIAEPALSQRLGRQRWRTLALNTKRSSSLTDFVRRKFLHRCLILFRGF